MGKGDDTRSGFNKRKFDIGYDRAYAMCQNAECPLRYKCYRYLATPKFKQNYGEFVPIKGKCEFFVKDQPDVGDLLFV